VLTMLRSWGPAALWAAVLFFMSTLSDVPGDAWFPLADKVGHLGLYGVLGATLAWGRHRSGARMPHAWPVAAGIAYGLSDEWHQSFVPGRDVSLGDWGADTLGVVLGYWFVSALFLRTSNPSTSP